MVTRQEGGYRYARTKATVCHEEALVYVRLKHGLYYPVYILTRMEEESNKKTTKNVSPRIKTIRITLV